MQKIYEWRARIGKAGLDAVEAVWASDQKYESAEARKSFVEFALGSGLPFMYGEIAHLGGDTYKVRVVANQSLCPNIFVQASKSFMSPLILQAFSSHLRDISLVDNDIFHSVIDEALPCGALILAVTAVERALTLYRTGVKDGSNKKSEASFSDTVWGTVSLYYTKPIKKIRKGKYQVIIKGAREYCKDAVHAARMQVVEKLKSEVIEVDDDRAQIAVSSDIESELADGSELASESGTGMVSILNLVIQVGLTRSLQSRSVSHPSLARRARTVSVMSPTNPAFRNKVSWCRILTVPVLYTLHSLQIPSLCYHLRELCGLSSSWRQL